MTTPTPRGTRFPSLPKLPDPSSPIQALRKTIEDLMVQSATAIQSMDELDRNLREGTSLLGQAIKERLKSPPPIPGRSRNARP